VRYHQIPAPAITPAITQAAGPIRPYADLITTAAARTGIAGTITAAWSCISPTLIATHGHHGVLAL
jgi:hypothetical protein